MLTRTWSTSACGTLIAILGLLSAVAAEADTSSHVSLGDLSLNVHGPDQGLAGPVVWSLADSPQGIVRAGTEGGVFRFDGGRFRGDTRTFEVTARFGQGASGAPASSSFTTLPAWWQTWWFRTLAVLAAMAIIVWGARWRMRALLRQNVLLEGTVAARTAELHAANDQLRDLSLTDPLTGLRNRRYLSTCMVEDSAQTLRRRFEAQIGGAERLKANIDLLFVMVDLDHFKIVNDTYGHAAGDVVLKRAAEVIRSATRNSDTVVRWGGEEFLVVARGTSRQHAPTVVERIRLRMEQHEFEVKPGRSVRLTCSLGFAFFPLAVDRPGSMTWDLVVNLADQCLYAAKRSGRNGWVGLVGADGVNADAGVDDLVLHLADHIASGTVQMTSSRPPGTSLEWTRRAGS